MGVALHRIGDAHVVRQLGPAGFTKKLRPLHAAVGRHGDITILGRVNTAASCAHHPVVTDLAAGRLVAFALQVLDQHKSGKSFVHRHVDQAAAPGHGAPVQRGKHGAGQAHAGDLVGEQALHKAGHAVVAGIEGGQARRSLDHVVDGRSVGTGVGLGKAGGGAIQDARVDRSDRLVGEVQPVHRAAPDVVDEHVSRTDELAQHGAPVRRFEVDGDRTLAAVEIEENAAHAVRCDRTGVAHDVALGRLDLDDVGAVVGEDLRGQRPEHHRREVNDAHPGQQ